MRKNNGIEKISKNPLLGSFYLDAAFDLESAMEK
jgi:hypothetical protein